MIQKIKSYALTLVALLTFSMPALVPVIVSADQVCNGNSIGDQVSKGANGAAGSGASSTCTSGTGVNQDSVAKIGHEVVNIFSLVVGVIAIIMIIVGGF